VIALIGDLPSGRRRNDDNSDDDDRKDRAERRMEAFKDYTRLERKDGPLHLEKVMKGRAPEAAGLVSISTFRGTKRFRWTTRNWTSAPSRSTEIKAKFTLKDIALSRQAGM